MYLCWHPVTFCPVGLACNCALLALCSSRVPPATGYQARRELPTAEPQSKHIIRITQPHKGYRPPFIFQSAGMFPGTRELSRILEIQHVLGTCPTCFVCPPRSSSADTFSMSTGMTRSICCQGVCVCVSVCMCIVRALRNPAREDGMFAIHTPLKQALRQKP